MIVLFLSAFCSWFILRGLIPRLSHGFLDQPNSRSSHRQPIPRGGGLVFVAMSSICSLIALLNGYQFNVCGFPLIAAPLAFVGLLDDRYNLPASLRYSVQLITAFLIFVFSPLVQQMGLDVESVSWQLTFAFALLVFSVTAVINFTNFMDGLDGLVAGCMFVAISSISLALHASWSMWALVGSLFGFLLWNWSPAKVFMGDVGSTFLGAVFAGLVLQASTWPQAFAYLLVSTPLIADACICVLRRTFAGQSVFQAHRLHVFQRLHLAGWSHARVSFTYISATTLLALAMLAGGWTLVLTVAIVELLIGVWLDRCVAVPFDVVTES